MKALCRLPRRIARRVACGRACRIVRAIASGVACRIAGEIACCLAFCVLCCLGWLPAAAAGTDAPLFEQPPPGTPNFTGKWALPGPITHLLTVEGKEPPLNAAGRALYAQRQAALEAGDRSIDPISDCLMHGTPRLLYAPHPFLILQTTRSIAFVHEVNHTFRIIYWNAPLPEDPDPDYLGYSSARFEGTTLVIDTKGLNDRTWLDYSGLPHGERLQVQERYTLSGRDTIHGTVTLTDPDFYSAPWTTTFTLRRQSGMTLEENVCKDSHRM